MSAGESAKHECYLDTCAPVDIVAGKQIASQQSHDCWLACFDM